MKLPSLQRILLSSIISLILIGILFSWKLWDQFRTSLPIDASRFSHFGDFVAGIAGFVNFLLLIYVYRETKGQSFQSSFFNHLQVLNSITSELKSNSSEILALNRYAVGLFNEVNHEEISKNNLTGEYDAYRKMPAANGYFEILYRILHIRYKYKIEPIDNFFKDENWRIGHYFRTFISVVETIKENHDLETEKLRFYIRVLKSRSTSDELRLILYYIISRRESEKIKLAKLFNFDFFDEMDDGLIRPGDMDLYKSNFMESNSRRNGNKIAQGIK